MDLFKILLTVVFPTNSKILLSIETSFNQIARFLFHFAEKRKLCIEKARTSTTHTTLKAVQRLVEAFVSSLELR